MLNKQSPFHRSYKHKRAHARKLRKYCFNPRLQRITQPIGDKQTSDEISETTSYLNDPSRLDMAGGPVDNLNPSAAMMRKSRLETIPLQLRIMLLRKAGKASIKLLSLLNRITIEGVVIQTIEITEVASTDTSKYDLILLECLNAVENEMLLLLSCIRNANRAPLMMLTDNHTLDWSLCALQAGADAIVTVNTPDEIIIARCNALLRRWLPSRPLL